MKSNKYDALLRLLVEKGKDGIMEVREIYKALNIDRRELEDIIGYIQDKREGFIKVDHYINSTRIDIYIPFIKIGAVKGFLEEGGFAEDIEVKELEKRLKQKQEEDIDKARLLAKIAIVISFVALFKNELLMLLKLLREYLW